MNKYRWQITLGLSLIALSTALYFLHYLIFRDPRHIFIYMVGDIAFVPIEVLLVTLIIHQVLSIREKRTLLEKLNMIIGAFYSEAGTRLLALISDADPRLGELRENLLVDTGWTDAEFSDLSRKLKNRKYTVDLVEIDLRALEEFLVGKRDFMVRLLENPNLLEHEAFTELLWAVFHLTEELDAREELPKPDCADAEHLAGDVERVYGLLVREWVDYMRHLKSNYPYLFSLAMRTNPFDMEATPVVS